MPRPGMSTPCQKLEVAKSTDCTSARKRSSSRSRGASPWRMTVNRRSRTAVSSCTRSSARWLVNRISALPAARLAEADDVLGDGPLEARARAGSGASGGRYRSACSASSNGDGSCSSRAPSIPSLRRTKPRSSPVASVAEHRIGAADAIPERLAQHLADHHGSGAQARAELGALAPDDRLVGVRIEALLEREGEALRLARDEIALVPSALEVRRERRERAAQAARRGDRQRGEVGGAHAPARVRVAERGRERGAVALHVDEIGARPRAAVALARALDLAREPDQVRHADARAEPLGSDVLELVRLVEDDDVVLGQHSRRARRRRSAGRGRRSTARGSRTRSRPRRRAPGRVRSSRSTAPGSARRDSDPRRRSAATRGRPGGAKSSSARSPVCVLASHGRSRSSAAGWSGSISRCSTSFAASRQM